MGARVPSARANAIRDALLRRAVPLSRLDQGRLQPLATAALVRDGDRVGLVTAAHIFERAHWGDLAIPLPRDGRVARLHSARVRLVMHPDNDVAILWIGDRSLAQRLGANWKATSTAGLTITSPTTATYVLVGYPACNARRVDGCVFTKPLVLFTESIDTERYLYARTAERIDGVTIWTPELDGVSGAMLWRISDEDGDDVACVLRPAAIQVAFTHNAHLRAESITYVLELLKSSRPQ
ncbi:MAG: hypothetical protein ACXW16_09195 [Burkholderiaceae bacterium]